jgi:NitT/TauT family transport system ATP-binding protein
VDQSSAASPPRIIARHVFKSFRRGQQVNVLADLSLEIPDGSFVALLGPSGCGKTTLLRMLNGLLRPDSGEILISGKPPEPGPSIGFVFQSFRLIPWATVRSNVRLPLDVTELSRAEKNERVEQLIRLVGLAQFADSYPAELSGGMKQRVALARALSTRPTLLLMDEPFASIDAMTRELMQLELMRLLEKHRASVVFVTHSVDEAVFLADRILLMGLRPGRIIEAYDVNLPRPRWQYDVRGMAEFVELRRTIWERIRAVVATDPASEFHGRVEVEPAGAAADGPA